MSFIMKKKKFKFNCSFSLEELSSVPFVNGVLFSKVRLLDGGNFTESSTREEVSNHCVKWMTKFYFPCKLNANVSTGILDPCICRVSVRKEVKGGKSYVKLGYVDVNLAEYAGATNKSRRYLLEGYDSKHRQDNSILKVTIGMALACGDPCFKAPDVKELVLPGEVTHAGGSRFYLGSYTKSADELIKGGSIASHGSTISKSKARPSVLSSGLVSPDQEGAAGTDDVTKGHSRSSSYNSQHSRTGSTHSRSSSNYTEPSSSGNSVNETTESGRNSWTNSVERRRKEEGQRRVDDTRIDADEVIQSLIQQQDFTADSKSGDEGDQGLQLFIAKDGSTALGSQQIKNRMTAGVFEKVVIDKR
ncbi:early estrogen-induced gene 1 protein-like [Glandiceps talaboti]